MVENIDILIQETMDGKAEHCEAAKVPFRPLHGNILYLGTYTRPDSSFSVDALSRFVARPCVVHWKAAKRSIRYILRTVSHEIMIRNISNNNV